MRDPGNEVGLVRYVMIIVYEASTANIKVVVYENTAGYKNTVRELLGTTFACPFPPQLEQEGKDGEIC